MIGRGEVTGELLGLGEGLLVVIAKLKAVESLTGVRPPGEIAAASGLVNPLGLALGVSGWVPDIDGLLDLFLFRLAEETDLVWALATPSRSKTRSM